MAVMVDAVICNTLATYCFDHQGQTRHSVSNLIFSFVDFDTMIF